MRRRGVPMQVRRVELAEVARFRSAFFTNTSRTAVPLSCIDANGFATDPDLLALLEDCMTITHTGVPEAVGGRGIASALATAAFDTARREHWRVVPACSYALVWIERHPEYADLVDRS